MRVLAIALVVGLVSFVGEPAGAVTAEAHKVFLRDCTLTMRAGWVGASAKFRVLDSGDGCGGYLVRGISMTTTSGYYRYQPLDRWDRNTDLSLEDLSVIGPTDPNDAFVSGNALVYVPYRARCDRYQLRADSTMRVLDSWPCSGTRYPPGIKVFENDCALHTYVDDQRGGTQLFTVQDQGSGCGGYQVSALSLVSTTGQYVSDPSPHDADPDTDHEWMGIATQGGDDYHPTLIAYVNLLVRITGLERFDHFLISYPSETFRLLDSWPCS